MPRMTPDELETLLRGVNRCQPVTLTTITQATTLAKVNGTPNPYHKRVTKYARVNGYIFFWYARCVNRQRTREDLTPDFESLPRHYGEHIQGTPLVIHEDGIRLYLPIRIKRWLDTSYEVDGVPVDNEIVEPWLREQREGTRQGVDNPVVYRNYSLSSIYGIAIDKEQIAIDFPVGQVMNA